MTKDIAKKARVSRESRLLFVTIGVAAIVLLGLARMRFPKPPAVDTATPPLERLAARASYDALAADIERVRALVAPNLIVLRLASPSDPTPRRLQEVFGHSAPDRRHVVALRVDAGTAAAAIRPGERVVGIVGAGSAVGTADVLAIDALRNLARLRVSEAPARELTTLALSAVRTPAYVVAVEGTQAGASLRPVFLGHGDSFAAARWARPVLPLGGVALAPGALLFSLAGEFLGCAVSEDGGLAVAGAPDVLEAVAKLAQRPAPRPASAGVVLQPMTPALAAATGAMRGVVVSEVDPEGPAFGVLLPADVIIAVDGLPAENPDDLLLALAARPVGAEVSISVVRMGEPHLVAVTLTASERDPAPEADRLLPGDVIMRAGTLSNPTPAQLRRLLSRSTHLPFVIVVVRREGRQHVLAIRAAGSDAPRK